MKKQIIFISTGLVAFSLSSLAAPDAYVCLRNDFSRDGGATYALFEPESDASYTKATLVQIGNAMGRISYREREIRALRCQILPQAGAKPFQLHCERDDRPVDGTKQEISLGDVGNGQWIVELRSESVDRKNGKYVTRLESYGYKSPFRNGGLSCDTLNETGLAYHKEYLAKLKKTAELQQKQ